MSESMSDRLRQARQAAGYSSAAAASEAFGWAAGAYRHHENGTRAFDVDAARRYARAYKVSPAWLLLLEKSPLQPADDAGVVEVTGSVVAGVWRESSEWPTEDRYEVMLGPSPIVAARRFGLEVEGLSMDLVFPPGTILDCLSIFDIQDEPQSNDFVVVERIREDGRRELTVKEYHEDDGGRRWLLPRSSRPEFQAPIEVGFPDRDHDTDAAVQVIAVVIGSYRPHSTSRFTRQARRRPDR